VGLVVSLPALEKAQCYVNKNVVREQQALIDLAQPKAKDGTLEAGAHVADFRALVESVLGWDGADLVAPTASMEVAVREYDDVLKPSWIVPGPSGDDGAPKALAIVELIPKGMSLDEPRSDARWPASPQARFERLLRENEVPVGVLFNGVALRLVYAPRGESSGHATFEVAPMCEPSGRRILGAMHMLLSAERLLSLPEPQRLTTILKDSRRYQNEVSTKLSGQVLEALHQLLRGFQAANEASREQLLVDLLREDRDKIYGGLLATLLRLVFILYAEDRGLFPSDAVYVRNYSVTALFEKLREDAARFTDTMDQRFGAWARLLTLFRLIHDGGGHGALKLPMREGRLFDPDAYPFLEGRPHGSARQTGERLDVPRISDGVVYRVLDNLLLLDGDRLSYRALDVEQIGSVYEAMMGFGVEVVSEPSIAVRPQHVVVGLRSLIGLGGAERLKRLADDAGCKVTGKAQDSVKKAGTVEELAAALAKSASPFTPDVVAAGSLMLQPTEERRRSGSHYTPRALTEPIVEKTLRPLFEDMGEHPTPQQILALNICDPAMGSGAFLVAACRALGDKLVTAWQRHGMPAIPPDEDIVLHARRVVAQRCLYGVDKNPFAVDLAKLSLWLVTLAKDHPFTFLDHALRQGDSLVGLSREQIASLHWKPDAQVPIIRKELDTALARAEELRARIHELGDSDDTREKQRLLRDAEDALSPVRKVGDAVIDAFFSGKNDKERQGNLKELRRLIETRGLVALPETPEAAKRTPFHWEIEFPEVFSARSPSDGSRL
jgi:hypothetical protein